MRLIDADALFEVIEKSMAENPHKEKTQRAMHIHEHRYFLTLLTTFPTIQPVATDTNVGDTISRQPAIDAVHYQRLNGMGCMCRTLTEGFARHLKSYHPHSQSRRQPCGLFVSGVAMPNVLIAVIHSMTFTTWAITTGFVDFAEEG